jgi:hypothetical protein
MFSPEPSGIPANWVISLGVSDLTKGSFVSKFLGYLYSKGGRKVAGVIECDYSLPTGCVNEVSFHFDFIERNPHQRGFTYSSVPAWEYPFTKKDFPGGGVLGLLAYPALRELRSKSTDWRPRRYTLEGAIRHVLMMTAPQLGILVSLKQADEALRKGRNTWVKIDENWERN